MSTLPKPRIDGIVTQEVGNEVLLYDSTSFKATHLNEVATKVYQACKAGRTFSQLKASANLADEAIHLALDQLAEENLLSEDFQPRPAELSRRDLLGKLGLGLAVLPALSYVLLPSPAAAQSCGGTQPSGTVLGCATGQTQCSNNSSPCTSCSATVSALPSAACPPALPFLCTCD